MHFHDVAEAVEIVDIARIGTDRDLAAAVLVLVDEAHPQAEVVLPLNLVFERPVKPVRSVRVTVRAIEIPELGHRVLVMPRGAAHAHKIATGEIGCEGRRDAEVAREQGLHNLIPFIAAGLRGLLPQSPGLGEAMLLVLVHVVVRIMLHTAVFEQRLGQTVPVLHGAQAARRGAQHISVFYGQLGVVHGRIQALLARLVQGRGHNVFGSAEEFHPGPAHALDVANPLPRLGRRCDRSGLLGIEDGVDGEPRTGDGVGGELLGDVDLPGRAVIAADGPAAGDTVGQPQF